MQDSATTGPIGKAGADDAGAGKRKRPGWDNLSYTTRVTAAFAFIAAMTALVAIGVVSFVWEQHFQTYTRENMVSTAESVAKDIAANYEKSGTFDAQTLAPARYMVNVTPSIGMRVVDNTVPANTDQSVVFDSTLVENGEDAAGGVSLVPKHAKPEQMVTVPIEVKSPDNEMTQAVGSVSVWVLGSDTLLRSTDEEFRNKSYQAMFFAAAMAILLASCIGFLFARNLVGPINRMTKTAKAIKEGDLSARTDLHGEDEIARLGETFDEMADSVEKDRELERRLTTDVAHELRTPLMAIQSTVEAMVDGVFEADPEHLETVNSEVQRLSRLVDSLLKLSRLENRANPMKEEVVDVGQLISGIIATHDAFVTDSGLTLEYVADARKEPAEKPSQVTDAQGLASQKAAGACDPAFVRLADQTPQGFVADHLGVNLRDYVVLGNVPGKSRPYGAILEKQYRWALDGVPTRTLNMPIEVLKDAVIAQHIGLPRLPQAGELEAVAGGSAPVLELPAHHIGQDDPPPVPAGQHALHHATRTFSPTTIRLGFLIWGLSLISSVSSMP